MSEKITKNKQKKTKIKAKTKQNNLVSSITVLFISLYMSRHDRLKWYQTQMTYLLKN